MEILNYSNDQYDSTHVSSWGSVLLFVMTIPSVSIMTIAQSSQLLPQGQAFGFNCSIELSSKHLCIHLCFIFNIL